MSEAAPRSGQSQFEDADMWWTHADGQLMPTRRWKKPGWSPPTSGSVAGSEKILRQHGHVMHQQAREFLAGFAGSTTGRFQFDVENASDEMDAEELKREALRVLSPLTPIGIEKEHLGDILLLMDRKGRVLSISYQYGMLFAANSGVELINWNLGLLERPAEADCIAALGSPNSTVRRRAAFALGQNAPRGPLKVVQSLVSVLIDERSEVRYNAAAALGNIAALAFLDEAELLVREQLLERFHDKDDEVRRLAAFAMGNFGASGRSLVSELVKHLQSPREDTSALASMVLACMGPVAEAALPALSRLDRSESENVRLAARQAIKEIEDSGDLIHRLTHWGTRCVSFRECDGLGSVPRVTHAMIRALDDTDAQVRNNAADALGVIGVSAKEAVPALVRALRDTDTGVRISAVISLRRFGAEAREATIALEELLTDAHESVRKHAARALRAIRSSDKT
jgi:HEAT repeat protein